MNPHQSHPASLKALFVSLWHNRNLIWQMSKREVVGRYRGSVMGLAWSFFNPVLMLAVYTFVFSVVFKARWGIGGEESKVDFAIVLFVGLIVHALFAECVIRAPGLILSNVNYVKKVVFPLEILPWVALGSALFHVFVSLMVLLVIIFILELSISWTVVLFPLVILPLVFATIGVAWFLAATGVFVRDVSQTTGIITMVMLFLAPVFYPMSALPEKYQLFLLINPLTFIIEESRQVLIFGQLPDWAGLAIYLAVSVMTAWLGFWWFQKTRRGFADVL
jgi:lipopolysaccharide transport system permease protein